jgi:hypothetical protein
MLTTGIQSLPEPLAWAQAAYHHGIARLAPASAGRPARRVERFASSAEFVLHDPDAAQRPPALAKDLRTVPRLGTLLPQVPRGTMALMGGDFGNIQMVDPATGSRPLATQASFGRELLVCFAVAEDVPSTSGRPTRQGARTAVARVHADPGFTPRREIAAAAAFRAVQSTPLADYTSHLTGTVPTRLRRPHRPSDLDLRIMELYAGFAGEALARHLGRPQVTVATIRPAGAMVTPCSVPPASGKPPCRSRRTAGHGPMTAGFASRGGGRGPSAQLV